MRAVIIEDEKKNSDQLKNLLAKNCPQVAIIGEGTDAESGQQVIRELQPDIVFLDIQLPGKSGFEMLSELSPCSFDIIFVSGYDKYGIQAIKCSALDYLLKPVKPKDLMEAVRKAENSTSKKFHEDKIANLLTYFDNTNISNCKIVLPFMKEARFVRICDIVRCESDRNYTLFYMNDGERLLVTRGLASFEDQLQPFGFIRPHQSHLVNPAYIKIFRKDSAELILFNNNRIPVSRMKLEQLKRTLRLP